MLRANRDVTRQKDPKGFAVQTSRNELKTITKNEDEQLQVKKIYTDSKKI